MRTNKLMNATGIHHYQTPRSYQYKYSQSPKQQLAETISIIRKRNIRR
uniref:Uncharacterized protein n=1 Tax=Rhizophora mucronata TaxID=61149 RepID=A0A2P2P5V3_RHIMU